MRIEKITQIDCCPNAGAISLSTRILAEEFNLEFSEPVSRHYNRAHGYDYQNYETLADNTHLIYNNDEGMWVGVVHRNDEAEFSWLERKLRITSELHLATILALPISEMEFPEVKFFPEIGGTIDFEYDGEKYYAASQMGTSVPLWEGEIVFVPNISCRCSNEECTGPEFTFMEEDIIPIKVKPVYTTRDSQSYANKYECWVNVQLFDQDMVDAECPQGYVPAICTFQNEICKVEQFLWELKELKKD